jgi:hypothetical protein
MKMFLVLGMVLAAGVFFYLRDSRALYEGYVSIDPTSLVQIKGGLESNGCRGLGYEGEIVGTCSYTEGEVPELPERGVEVFLKGPGMGPVSFYITDDKIWAAKDIPGIPNKKKFQKAVRQDVVEIGDIVTIQEDSWHVTKIKYPWKAIY